MGFKERIEKLQPDCEWDCDWQDLRYRAARIAQDGDRRIEELEDEQNLLNDAVISMGDKQNQIVTTNPATPPTA